MVEAHLAARRLNDKWLYGQIAMSKGSYYDMWRRGSVRVDVLSRIAGALGLTMSQLLTAPGESVAAVAEPAAEYRPRPRFLEERVDDLERQIETLKNQLKKR